MTNNDITPLAGAGSNINGRIRKDIDANKQFVSLINNKMFKGYNLLKLKHANSHFNIKRFVKALPKDYYPIYDNYNIYYREKYLAKINKKYNKLNDLIQVNKCKSCFNIKNTTGNAFTKCDEHKTTCTNEAVKEWMSDNEKRIYAKIPFIILNKEEEGSKRVKQKDFLYQLSHNEDKTRHRGFSYENGLCNCRTVMNAFSNKINSDNKKYNTNNKDTLTLNVTSYNNKRKNKEKIIMHHKWKEITNDIWNTFSSFKRNVNNEIDNIFEHDNINIQEGDIKKDNNITTNIQSVSLRSKDLTKKKDIFTLNKHKYKTTCRRKFRNVFLYMDNKDNKNNKHNISKESKHTKCDTFHKEALIRDRHLIDMLGKCCTNEEIETVFGGKDMNNRHFMNYAKSRIATTTRAKNYK